jgi:hypothetical protein
MSDLSNDTKIHTMKSRETIPLSIQVNLFTVFIHMCSLCILPIEAPYAKILHYFLQDLPYLLNAFLRTLAITITSNRKRHKISYSRCLINYLYLRTIMYARLAAVPIARGH